MNGNSMSGAAGARTASILNVIAGVWLIISSFVLGYTALPTAVWDTLIVGVVVVIFSWVRAAYPARNVGLSWLNLLLGVWLIISPFIFAYGAFPRPTWNDVILGIIVGVLAIWSAVAAPSPLWRRGRGPTV